MTYKLVLDSNKTPRPKAEMPNMVLLTSLPSLVLILCALKETNTPIK